MTRDELIDMLTARKAEKTPLTPHQLFLAIDNLNVADKQQLTDAVNARESKPIAEILIKAGNRKRKNLANALVVAALADDTILTSELLDLL